MTATATSAVSLYDGRTALGHVMPRGWSFEAFTAEGKSIGVFSTQRAALAAISDEANRRCDPGGET